MTHALIHPGAPALDNDSCPVERAVAERISGQNPPETFLQIQCHRPGGGLHLRFAWTPGAALLGDRIDAHALGSGLDAADWLYISDRHCTRSGAGGITVEAYPLRLVIADVRAGIRGSDDCRDALARIVRSARGCGRTQLLLPPPWLGFGPARLTRDAACPPGPETRTGPAGCADLADRVKTTGPPGSVRRAPR